MATTNPFSLLDSDDESTPTQRQQPKVAAKKTAVTKPKATKSKAQPANARRTGGNQGSDFNAAGKEQRRPRGRNNNNQRGGNNQRRNKQRQFDRHSGTGFGKEIKKDGGGSHNWGKPGDEVAEEVAAENDEETPVEAEEDQTPELTLEDFEAIRREKRQGEAFAELEVRKGNAPVDGQAYAKKSAEEAEEESFLQMGSKKEKRTRERKAEKSRILDVNFKVQTAQPAYDNDRNFRGNRGRGGKRNNRGRGAGNRGRGQGRAQRGAPVDASDTNAFPTLGN